MRRLAGTLYAVGVLTLVPGLIWQLEHSASGLSWTALAAQALGLVALGGVGLVLATRRPDNSLGWIFLGVWLYSGLVELLLAYAQWQTLRNPPIATASIATWLVNWAWVPIVGVIAFYPLLLFPTGHVLGRRWRAMVPGGAAVILAWTVAFALQPSQYADAFGDPIAGGNPYASPWIPSVIDHLPLVLALIYVALVVTAFVSVVLRYRRGDSVIRAQLKWFLLGGLCWLPVLLYPGDHGEGGGIDVLLGLALAGVPIAMAVAILRYRLYDIDRIISRTASYTIVTGLLIATYAVIVTAATRLLPESSTLAVAAATLTAAALARPLLRRVQLIVDRRFNRARYDAQHTVDEFATRLRSEVSPPVVLSDLQHVVVQTLEPARAAVWTSAGGAIR